MGQEKFNKEKAANGDRLKWGQLIVSVADSHRRLLETVQIDDLAREIQIIKEKIELKE